jgi:hypothetical protein
MDTDWKDYLAKAELSLKKLNQDQTATVAKMMALQIGAFSLKYGDDELEDFENHVDGNDLSNKGKQVFIKGY